MKSQRERSNSCSGEELGVEFFLIPSGYCSRTFAPFWLPTEVLMDWDSGHGNEKALKVSEFPGTSEVMHSSQKDLKREKEKGMSIFQDHKGISNKDSLLCVCAGEQTRRNAATIMGFVSSLFPCCDFYGTDPYGFGP